MLLIDWTLILLTHLAASIQDIRTREISDWTWILCGVATVPLGAYVSIAAGNHYYTLGVIVGIILGAVIYYLRLMGGADAKSLVLISLSIPTVDLGSVGLTVINLTPLSILINSLIIALVVYVPYNLINNLRTKGCPGGGFLVLMLLTCVPAHEVLRKPNNYSIAQAPSGSGFKPILRLGLGEVDPREIIVRWISEGRISIDTPVLTTYHIPYIVPITLALLLYLITGRNILTYIIQ